MIINFISNSKNRRKVEFRRLIFQIMGLVIFAYYGSQSTMYIVLLSIPLSLLFGPVYCGWVCPRGLFQDIFALIGRKMLGNKYDSFIPASLHPKMMSFRYILLGMVAVIFVLSELKLISEYFQIFLLEFLVVIMIVSVLLSLFIERAACKYFCKEGAVGGMCNFLKLNKIKRDISLCNLCGICDRVCPMCIEISKKDVVNAHSCISCFKCVQRCPMDALMVAK